MVMEQLHLASGESSKHVNGMPCWVDLLTEDIERSKEFYSGVFGWEFSESDAGAGYLMAELDGKKVAGFMPQSEEQLDQGMPSTWNVYLAADNASETLTVAEGGGGQVLLPATDVATIGTMAAIADPAGIPAGFWQAGTHPGAEVLGIPGSLAWVELVTDAPDQASDFYADVLGWSVEEEESGYRTFSVGGKPVGGVTAQPRAWLQNQWIPYFAVPSLTKMLDLVGSMGAIIDEPTEYEWGVVAPVRDTLSVMFHMVELPS